MAYKNPSQKLKKVMLQPINLIFRHLQSQTKVAVWLEENTQFRLEGVIAGFDEFMNIVMRKTEEVHLKKGKEVSRKEIGTILLKGDNISLIQPANLPILSQTSD